MKQFLQHPIKYCLQERVLRAKFRLTDIKPKIQECLDNMSHQTRFIPHSNDGRNHAEYTKLKAEQKKITKFIEDYAL